MKRIRGERSQPPLLSVSPWRTTLERKPQGERQDPAGPRRVVGSEIEIRLVAALIETGSGIDARELGVVESVVGLGTKIEHSPLAQPDGYLLADGEIEIVGARSAENSDAGVPECPDSG